MAKERKEKSWAPMEALRKKRKALRQRRIRTRDVAALAQIERELFKVEEQLVSKKIASGCRSRWLPRAQPLPVSYQLRSQASLSCRRRAFKAAGWEVVSLDIVSKFEPTILCNIRSWDYALFPPGHFDMVWARPGLHGVQPSFDDAPLTTREGRRAGAQSP